MRSSFRRIAEDSMPILSLMVALHRRDSTIFKVFFLFYR